MLWGSGTLDEWFEPHQCLLLLANEICEGYVFTRVCLSTGGGWYPSMPCRYPGGVSRPTARGGGLRGLAVRVSRPTFRGVSRPTPGGAGVSRPTPWDSGVSQHALRQTPPADGYCCGQYASYWNALLYTSRWMKWLNCHFGHQEISRCCSRSESEESVVYRISGPTKRIYVFQTYFLKQECIPVGCVPPACCPYLPAYTAPWGVYLVGVYLPGGVPAQGRVYLPGVPAQALPP